MASSLAHAVKKLLPSKLPPSLSSQPGNLYEVLSRYPQDGVGQKVYQTRWGTKGIEGCYWEVTKTKLKLEGTHGKAWGRLVWRGKRVNEQPTQIRGGLKYKWAEGVCQARHGAKSPPPAAPQSASS